MSKDRGLLVPPAAQDRQDRPFTTYLSHSQTKARIAIEAPPLALASVSRYFPAAVAKTYVVTLRSHNDDDRAIKVHRCGQANDRKRTSGP